MLYTSVYNGHSGLYLLVPFGTFMYTFRAIEHVCLIDVIRNFYGNTLTTSCPRRYNPSHCILPKYIRSMQFDCAFSIAAV